MVTKITIRLDVYQSVTLIPLFEKKNRCAGEIEPFGEGLTSLLGVEIEHVGVSDIAHYFLNT